MPPPLVPIRFLSISAISGLQLSRQVGHHTLRAHRRLRTAPPGTAGHPLACLQEPFRTQRPCVAQRQGILEEDRPQVRQLSGLDPVLHRLQGFRQAGLPTSDGHGGTRSRKLLNLLRNLLEIEVERSQIRRFRRSSRRLSGSGRTALKWRSTGSSTRTLAAAWRHVTHNHRFLCRRALSREVLKSFEAASHRGRPVLGSRLMFMPASSEAPCPIGYKLPL